MLYNYLYNYIYNNNNNSNFNYNKYKKILEYIPINNNNLHNNNINIFDSELINSIKKNIEKNIEKNSKKCLISLSGGVDSMVLISILKYLNYEIVALHINYNNRDESTNEEEFLEEWCNFNNIKLYVKKVEVLTRNNTRRSYYEEQTKYIRFNFYKEIMEKENCYHILLAHHKDDIIENIFANVCRGRYILDLGVINEKSMISNVTIIRPMIEYYKENIYNFSHNNNIPYFKDTTPDWSVRGKYRNRIFPLLEDTFSKNIKENLLGLSKQSYEWNNLITNEIIKPFMDQIIFNNEENYCVFNVTNYNNYPLCFWNVVFMKIFYNFGKNCPSRKGIQTFMNSIKTKNVCYISLSNNCNCRNKNFEIKIIFK
jgi:tRNA(Ile)-lysidine synthetase-like protein